MKPRILHVITGLDVGGAEMMLVKTLPKLDEFEHTVCTIRNEGPLAQPLKDAGIRVVTLDAASKGMPHAVREFRRLTRDKPDLCISYLIHADLFVRFLAPLQGIKRRVAFIRNNLIGSKYHRLLQVERATQGLVHAYFSVSAAVADEYIRAFKYPKEKFTVIQNGIFTEPIDAAHPLSRSELNLPEDSLIVLTVAKFFEQKGHRYLLEGWKAVREKFPTAHLLLAGEGPIRSQIEALVDELGIRESVHFLGVRSDVPRLLKTADLFVFPTLFEGMSNALLEAMASGTAIVTTAIPENREVATDDEVRFVPPRDSAALSQAIVELLSDPDQRQTRGELAKRRVAEQFTVARTVSRLREAYHKVLKA